MSKESALLEEASPIARSSTVASTTKIKHEESEVSVPTEAVGTPTLSRSTVRLVRSPIGKKFQQEDADNESTDPSPLTKSSTQSQLEKLPTVKPTDCKPSWLEEYLRSIPRSIAPLRSSSGSEERLTTNTVTLGPSELHREQTWLEGASNITSSAASQQSLPEDRRTHPSSPGPIDPPREQIWPEASIIPSSTVPAPLQAPRYPTLPRSETWMKDAIGTSGRVYPPPPSGTLYKMMANRSTFDLPALSGRSSRRHWQERDHYDFDFERKASNRRHGIQPIAEEELVPDWFGPGRPMEVENYDYKDAVPSKNPPPLEDELEQELECGSEGDVTRLSSQDKLYESSGLETERSSSTRTSRFRKDTIWSKSKKLRKIKGKNRANDSSLDNKDGYTDAEADDERDLAIVTGLTPTPSSSMRALVSDRTPGPLSNINVQFERLHLEGSPEVQPDECLSTAGKLNRDFAVINDPHGPIEFVDTPHTLEMGAFVEDSSSPTEYDDYDDFKDPLDSIPHPYNSSDSEKSKRSRRRRPFVATEEDVRNKHQFLYAQLEEAATALFASQEEQKRLSMGMRSVPPSPPKLKRRGPLSRFRRGRGESSSSSRVAGGKKEKEKEGMGE